MKTGKLFFTFARDDSEFVLKLAKDLRSTGRNPWVDQLNIPIGARWDRAVEKALHAAPCLLVVLSPASVASDNVMDEVSFGIENGKTIVPILYKDCDIPFRLKRLQYIDFRVDYDDGFKRLVQTLKALDQSEENAKRKPEKERSSQESIRARPPPQIRAYDVFISFKNLDENGVPTPDAELASEVYNFLIGKGLTVFISTVTLESLGVSDYKKAIDDALDAASIVVAVGTSTENLDSRWVRYEWDGFYHDILNGRKPDGKLFTYIAGLRPAELPRTLRQTQTFIHSSESLGQLHRFIAQALR
jgi:TIR domain